MVREYRLDELELTEEERHDLELVSNDGTGGVEQMLSDMEIVERVRKANVNVPGTDRKYLPPSIRNKHSALQRYVAKKSAKKSAQPPPTQPHSRRKKYTG